MSNDQPSDVVFNPRLRGAAQRVLSSALFASREGRDITAAALQGAEVHGLSETEMYWVVKLLESRGLIPRGEVRVKHPVFSNESLAGHPGLASG